MSSQPNDEGLPACCGANIDQCIPEKERRVQCQGGGDHIGLRGLHW